MADTVRDAIAAYVAEETRIVTAPVEPFGYGSETICTTALDPLVRTLPGTDARLLSYALVRRLDTPRGSLADDPEYGISLREMLHGGTTDLDLRNMEGRIYNELTKDDRVESLSVRVASSPAGDELAIAVDVTPADVLEAFTMTLAVTSGAIVLEAIQ